MKNLVLLGLVSMLFVSCGVVENSVDIDEIGLPVRIVTGNVSGVVYSDASSETGDSTVSTIDYAFYTPQFSSYVMDSVYKDSVNMLIYEMTMQETLGFEDELGFRPLTKSFFEMRMDSFVVAAQTEVDEIDSNPWSMETGFNIEEQETYVTLEYSGWTYTGGAHGNFWSSFYHIDKKTGRRMDLLDFVSDIEILEQIALPYFRAQNEVPDGMTLEEYGFWFEGDKLKLNENFYITEDSIVFVFNIYEIAPYAGGSTELIVPLSDLGELYFYYERD